MGTDTGIKRSSIIMLVAGVLLLVFAFTVPPYVTGQARTIPKDLDMTLVSESPQGYTRTEHLITAPTEEIDEIAVHVDNVVTDSSGAVVSEISDDLVLIGHSRYPVLKPTATISGSPADSTDAVREGLHYFLPANTLRNSYPYYDIVLGDDQPVDYVERDGNVFTFYQHLRYVPLDDFTHYSVERTLVVDRFSGIIVQKDETMTFHEADGDRNVEFSYTNETRELLQQRADDIDQRLEWAKALDFFSKFLGLLLLAIGVFSTGIFKQGRLMSIVNSLRK
ncbi:hypothetical protein CDES_12835 [Corynebacterium deserti GIMN1.010]|uniref:DUF3068 domain-containing protein n=1 Tax=Corynebacterium deserti GIMN1.010 TaxID=931089 RepID=A0A0M5IRK7_9CORY|nr:porin PorA family protein [Corynebacterium deserti]ALC06911.1 hypothetical protein CDES_12835 [Corynebacterium deserti GIMN1.010]